MKKQLTSLLLVSGLAFSGFAMAEEIKGTLQKIDGEFYVVKDAQGTEHRAHFDKTTKKKGDVAEGAMVELKVDNGHVTEIEVEKKK